MERFDLHTDNVSTLPEGSQLGWCDYCRTWHHRSAFQVGAKSCKWCRAAWRAKRDHGIRNGLYAAEELVAVVGLTDPPSPWAEDDVWMETPSPAPTTEELNAGLAPRLWLPGDRD